MLDQNTNELDEQVATEEGSLFGLYVFVFLFVATFFGVILIAVLDK